MKIKIDNERPLSPTDARILVLSGVEFTFSIHCLFVKRPTVKIRKKISSKMEFHVPCYLRMLGVDEKGFTKNGTKRSTKKKQIKKTAFNKYAKLSLL